MRGLPEITEWIRSTGVTVRHSLIHCLARNPNLLSFPFPFPRMMSHLSRLFICVFFASSRFSLEILPLPSFFFRPLSPLSVFFLLPLSSLIFEVK
jgi:hypothetical protein